MTSAPVDTEARPAIRVRHLWHRFGAKVVLRDVDFQVGYGEIFGFIGPNGAGKTTTIRIMSTLLEPMAGRVEIDGIDVSVDPKDVRRVIGYMPDHAGVYERITVGEYLDFFASASQVASKSVVDAVIELTDLGALRDQLVASLSKGMRQRLQLARVLLHDPKVLVMDEPASDLDPRARIEIRDLLLELRELGKTIFLSSHILSELSDVCTSVGVIEQGRLLVAGPIGEIADQLAERRSADAGGHAPAAADSPEQGAPAELVTEGGAVIPEAAHRRVKLRVLVDAAQVAPMVEKLEGVAGVESAAGGTLAIQYVGSERFVPDLVRYLVDQGVPIAAVEPEGNELERIFLEVTRGGVQ